MLQSIIVERNYNLVRLIKFNLNSCRRLNTVIIAIGDRLRTSCVRKYVLDSLQSSTDTQRACTMYRYSQNDKFIEHAVKRENLRSEETNGFK